MPALLPQRPLYLMAKPTPEPLDRIALLPRRCPSRRLDLAHVTLLPFADLAEEEPGYLALVLDLMKDFAADAFPVRFDHVREQRAVTLRFSRPMRGARRFQGELVKFLLAREFVRFGTPPKPHLTINYKRDGLGEEAIAPIAWTVEEVLLIESIYGEKTHVERGRWRLAPLLI